MGKQYTEIPIHQGSQAKTDIFNKNIEKSLSEFNGKLNGNNMPVNAIDTNNIDLISIPEIDVASGSLAKISSRAASQAYYSTSNFEWKSTDIWTPLTTIDLKTDNWRRGWNKLEDTSGWSTFPLRFESREGMLVGCAIIDWHRGENVVEYGQDPTVTAFTGSNWWTEWGVFVNNNLVARSGKIPPRRHTTQLPFSIPVGSQPIKIDIRWITTTDLLIGTSGFVGDPATDLDIFGAEIWTRNVYR